MSLPPATESMTLLVAAVIVHDADAGRVLLLRRGPQAKFGQGLWDLPTGKCDPGENIVGTAVRELAEETGVTVRPEDLTLAGFIHGAWGVESPNGFTTVVLATRSWHGTPVNREPSKHDCVVWTDTADVPAEFVPTVAEVLRGYLAGEAPGVVLRGW